MAQHCYLCGAQLGEHERHIRRLVRTGRADRFRYAPKALTNRRASYGMRVICGHCKKWQDAIEHRDEIFGIIQILAAVLVLIVLAVLKAHGLL